MRKVICVSLDKDLLTIPGWHYNFVTEVEKFVSPLEALRNFYIQLLEGDASDNIPAFDGKLRTKRPLFVQKLIDELYEMVDEKDMYCYVESLYGSDNLEKMLLNANLLYIQQKEGDIWRNPIMTDSGQQEDLEGSFVPHCGMPPDAGDLNTDA